MVKTLTLSFNDGEFVRIARIKAGLGMTWTDVIKEGLRLLKKEVEKS